MSTSHCASDAEWSAGVGLGQKFLSDFLKEREKKREEIKEKK